MSPFQRRDGCDRFGSITSCEKLKDGAVEVEFAQVGEAQNALEMTEFVYSVRKGDRKVDGSIQMRIEPHKRKYTSRGIINCYDLKDVPEEEIVDGLSEFGLIGARKMKTRRGAELIGTNNVILTFDSTDLLSEIRVGYIRVKVRLFLPNLLRCFKRQKYGHTNQYCRNRPVCSKCASLDYSSNQCTSEVPFCVNCGRGQDPHTSFDRACPSYSKEKEIMSINHNEKVTFREARDLYDHTHPRISYSS